MRILDKEAIQLNLETLGFRDTDRRSIQRMLDLPHGMVLVTGPTGSGKTTTLYAALTQLYDPSLKIITIEDPVEYELSGVNQIPVNPERGLTFANGLRSILRQDPDVIMVGEIRDNETADISVRAALTGHLIFSTLHTNDAVSAVGDCSTWKSSRSCSPACSRASSRSGWAGGSVLSAAVRARCPRSLSIASRRARQLVSPAGFPTTRSDAISATTRGSRAALGSSKCSPSAGLCGPP